MDDGEKSKTYPWDKSHLVHVTDMFVLQTICCGLFNRLLEEKSQSRTEVPLPSPEHLHEPDNEGSDQEIRALLGEVYNPKEPKQKVGDLETSESDKVDQMNRRSRWRNSTAVRSHQCLICENSVVLRTGMESVPISSSRNKGYLAWGLKSDQSIRKSCPLVRSCAYRRISCRDLPKCKNI